MKLPPERPLVLAASFALIRAISRIVPAPARSHFEYDWQQKLLHRWQFLFHTGLWDWREALRLAAGATCCVPDAVQHFGAQPSVRTRVSRFVQSPLTCLGLLAALLLVIAVFTKGLPATRDLMFKRTDRGTSKLVYVWSHNLRRGGDRPVPADMVEAWKSHSHLISSAAAFRAVHRDVQVDGISKRQLIITTEPSFFQVLGTQPVSGHLDADIHTPGYILLSYDAWVQLFHASPRVTGSAIGIAGQKYFIRGILPAGFVPLSKQTAIYLVQPRYLEQDAYAAVRVNSGVTQKMLNAEFTDIGQDVTYYFLNGQLRFGFAQTALWTPLRSFAVGALASLLMLLMVFRIKWSALWPASKKEKVWTRQVGFFATKTGLGLACVFTVCLEWSRSSSAILFGNFDPGTGPFLLWLYILGTMGILFWSAVDQKARCRQCLQLLAFPVRMGSPGNLLLEWSGIEFCCTEGHGVLHVPHLAPSWAEESDHWIELDDSWQDAFGSGKHR